MSETEKKKILVISDHPMAPSGVGKTGLLQRLMETMGENRQVTNLDYASTVDSMATGNVRHTGQKGYVYYPNIFGIRGPVILDDPQAIGSFFTELIYYAEQRAQYWISQGKSMMWT